MFSVSSDHEVTRKIGVQGITSPQNIGVRIIFSESYIIDSAQ